MTFISNGEHYSFSHLVTFLDKRDFHFQIQMGISGRTGARGAKDGLYGTETPGADAGICASEAGAVHLGICVIAFPPDRALSRAKRVPEKG